LLRRKKQTELGASLGDFGSSLLGLGKFEQPPLADQFLSMGEKSAVLAKNSQVSLTSILLHRSEKQKSMCLSMGM